MTLGDGWEHGITLEKILLVQEGVHYPICLRGNVRVHLKTVVGFVRSAMRPEARAVAYFDTSVLVKRYVNDPGASRARALLRDHQFSHLRLRGWRLFPRCTGVRQPGIFRGPALTLSSLSL